MGRAQKTDKGKGAKVRGQKLTVSYYNPRDYATDKHKTIDDRPYGGGPGMVVMTEPVLAAWSRVAGAAKNSDSEKKIKTLVMSPRGLKFNQTLAKKIAHDYDHLVLISGRYEGLDSRIEKITKATAVSVGDYVLTGGELPALIIIDAVARHLPGVLGTWASCEDERAAPGELYTRPEIITYQGKEYRVPKVLLQGNHKEIEAWRQSWA